MGGASTPSVGGVESAVSPRPIPRSVLKALREGSPRHSLLTLAECEDLGGYLYYGDRLYVPDLPELKAKLLESCHTSPVAGHPGCARTYEILDREYYWPQMIRFVQRWVANCHQCRRAKPRREGLGHRSPVLTQSGLQRKSRCRNVIHPNAPHMLD